MESVSPISTLSFSSTTSAPVMAVSSTATGGGLLVGGAGGSGSGSGSGEIFKPATRICRDVIWNVSTFFMSRILSLRLTEGEVNAINFA